MPSFEDWLESTNYNQARKDELRAAYERNRGGRPSKHRASHVDSFIKLESYPEFKEARWINSRSDDFKAYSGPFFKAIEEELYRNKWFIKHVPVPDRPALVNALAKSGLYYYENDYKAFESHFVQEIMESLELELYRYCLSQYPEDAEYICQVISGKNRLHTQAGIFYKVNARRMSGDMCTSLGNGFSNLMNVLFIVAQKGGYVEGFVEGDDGLFASTVPITEKDYFELGWTVEIKQISHPRKGHFCGMSCSEAGEVLKDPRRVFQTFGWTSSNIHAGSKIMDELLRAKAISLCYELPQCPIVGVLGRVAMGLTEGLSARFEPDSWKKIPADFQGPTGEFNPSKDARETFAELFQIPITVQLVVEDLIRAGQFSKIQDYLIPPSDVATCAARYVEVT